MPSKIMEIATPLREGGSEARRGKKRNANPNTHVSIDRSIEFLRRSKQTAI